MNDINWPEKYLPGTTDNFVSNEVIVASLTSAQVWPYLNDTKHWSTYYKNASEVGFEDGAGPELGAGVRFRFTTFGMRVEADVTEYVSPEQRASSSALISRVDRAEHTGSSIFLSCMAHRGSAWRSCSRADPRVADW